MLTDDGLGFLVLLAVVGGIILGELRSRKPKPKTVDNKAKHRKKHKIENDLSLEDSEFEEDDIDRDVDEMPDDSLIYDTFN